MIQLSGFSAPTDAILELDKRLVEDRKDVIGLSSDKINLRRSIIGSYSYIMWGVPDKFSTWQIPAYFMIGT
jgi:hypothetical protein